MKLNQVLTALIEARNSGESARTAHFGIVADYAAEQGWTLTDLEKDGKAQGPVLEMARAYSVSGQPSKSEVSKFKTFAHPKVRAVMPDIVANARELRAEYPEQRVDNVAMKLMSHMKSDEVTSVPQARDKAVGDYESARRDKENRANDPAGTLKSSLKSRLNSKQAKECFTELSLKVALEAIEKLDELEPVSTVETSQPTPAETPEPTPVETPDQQVVEALGNFDLEAMLSKAIEAKIAALMAK